MLAQNYIGRSELRARQSGDMGFIIRESCPLEKANADLRKVVMSLGPGQTTTALRTSEGYRILKLIITREPRRPARLERS